MAVKCLEEMEPFSTGHKTAVEASNCRVKSSISVLESLELPELEQYLVEFILMMESPSC